MASRSSPRLSPTCPVDWPWASRREESHSRGHAALLLPSFAQDPASSPSVAALHPAHPTGCHAPTPAHARVPCLAPPAPCSALSAPGPHPLLAEPLPCNANPFLPGAHPELLPGALGGPRGHHTCSGWAAPGRPLPAYSVSSCPSVLQSWRGRGATLSCQAWNYCPAPALIPTPGMTLAIPHLRSCRDMHMCEHIHTCAALSHEKPAEDPHQWAPRFSLQGVGQWPRPPRRGLFGLWDTLGHFGTPIEETLSQEGREKA